MPEASGRPETDQLPPGALRRSVPRALRVVQCTRSDGLLNQYRRVCAREDRILAQRSSDALAAAGVPRSNLQPAPALLTSALPARCGLRCGYDGGFGRPASVISSPR